MKLTTTTTALVLLPLTLASPTPQVPVAQIPTNPTCPTVALLPVLGEGDPVHTHHLLHTRLTNHICDRLAHGHDLGSYEKLLEFRRRKDPKANGFRRAVELFLTRKGAELVGVTAGAALLRVVEGVLDRFFPGASHLLHDVGGGLWKSSVDSTTTTVTTDKDGITHVSVTGGGVVQEVTPPLTPPQGERGEALRRRDLNPSAEEAAWTALFEGELEQGVRPSSAGVPLDFAGWFRPDSTPHPDRPTAAGMVPDLRAWLRAGEAIDSARMFAGQPMGLKGLYRLLGIATPESLDTAPMCRALPALAPFELGPDGNGKDLSENCAEIDAAVEELRGRLVAFRAECPGSKIVGMGIGQGGLVWRNLLLGASAERDAWKNENCTFASTPALNHRLVPLAAVALLDDPSHTKEAHEALQNRTLAAPPQGYPYKEVLRSWGEDGHVCGGKVGEGVKGSWEREGMGGKLVEGVGGGVLARLALFGVGGGGGGVREVLVGEWGRWLGNGVVAPVVAGGGKWDKGPGN
ncbi:hypothetical protein BJ508DRAFT_335241 [Ascobolus immersus RN42]|uniref:Phospholipase/carboxylesterase/thioesterase domain-containing protein n=1 Tax=Ascobolus immersus RN42 TaxID=1160509 RepID=A0A3N4HD66_ASCIM|nr:hypothetical protein BJ508DRAFT_335241 [Ascobolus immersus RN42]